MDIFYLLRGFPSTIKDYEKNKNKKQKQKMKENYYQNLMLL